MVATAKLLAYLAVSVDDFRDLLTAALAHSAAAMWLPPAVLLISTQAPGESALGIFLIANTARLLIAKRAPQSRGSGRIERARGGPSPLVMGALLFQAALCAWWLGYTAVAAALLALSVSIWTAAYLNSGVSGPTQPVRLARTVAAVVITLVLATLLTGTLLQQGAANQQPGFLETSQTVAGRFTGTSKSSSRALDKRHVTAIAASAIPNGVPGVILRPKPAPKGKVAASSPAIRFSTFHPVTFRFTGDYHLFPASSASLPEDSAILPGTPLNQVFATVGGSSVATEAFQKLDPPFDFTVWGKIQITLRNAEDVPIGAELQLVTSSGVQDLGTQIFGLPPSPEEKVEFLVQGSQAISRTTALRVLFRRVPTETSHSTRVEIADFTLLPK